MMNEKRRRPRCCRLTTGHPKWGLAVIHVDVGGVYELHGAYPTPWAKLLAPAGRRDRSLYLSPTTVRRTNRGTRLASSEKLLNESF